MNVWQAVFWILLIFAAIGAMIPDSPQPSPWLNRGRWVVALILIAILGWHSFGGLGRP